MNNHLALALGLALLLLPAVASAVAPAVSNLTVAQRAGTKLVDISYDASADTPTLFVSLEISSDGGTTFSVPAATASGVIGAGVTAGPGKTITWDAGADWSGQYSTQMRFKVSATESPAGMSLIPAGAFTMGDSLDGDGAAPPHQVNVSAFFMGQKEVSKAEWDVVKAWAVSHGYTDLRDGAGKATSHPVQTLAWRDVIKWCNARSEKAGLTPCYTVSGAVMKNGSAVPTVNWVANGYRLPTEAEWEKAARGGLSGKRFPWGDTISHTQANYNSSSTYSYDISPTRGYHPTYATGSYPYTSPVGSLTANGYGLQDMAGNILEWCWDWYGDYSPGAETDPRGSSTGERRVVRGGSYGSDAYECRAAYRYDLDPAGSVSSSVGFRLARSSVPAADAGSGYAVSADGVVDSRYKLTSASSTNGTISGVVADGKYLTGTTATLTAVPAAGYAFTGWTGAASGTVNPLALLMNGDKSIGATFVRQYTLTSNTPTNGSISGSAVDGKYLTGTTATLTAVPAAGYAFTGWTGAAAGTTNPVSLLMDTDKTIGATFTRQYTLSSGTVSHGTISGIVSGGKYLTGTNATLTAVPAAGYAFTGWTGNATGIDNPLSLLMDADKTIGANFTRQYTLTASVLNNGTISGVAVDGKYLTGTTAMLTAIPAAGYAFTGWTGAASGTVNPLSLLMNGDRTIGANFTRQYSLTASALSDGSISGIAVDGKYLTGTTATLTAVPAAGYAFTGWTGDATGTVNPLSLLMDGDKTIGAAFIRQYTLTASAVSNGTIGGIVSGGKYLTGTSATLTAVPAAGYVFTGWTGAASGTTNPLSLLMDADKTIGANFTRQYTLTSGTATNGSINGIVAGGKYLTGTTAELTAVPNPGYVFTGWTGAASGTANPLSVLMNGDKTIGATFTRQYTLTTDPLVNGAITGMTADGKYLTGTNATLTAVPAAGYAFTGWTGAATGTDNPLSLLMDADKTIGATFTRQYSLTASAVNDGSISGIAVDGRYLTGTTATLTAVPNPGYAFTGWTGDASGTSNPLSLLMDADKTIGANFTREYTLTVSALNNGTISGIALDGKYLTGTTATLTAVPAAGYVFTGWTGAASGMTNPLSLVMNSDKTIGATYVNGIEVLVDGQLPTGSEVVRRGSLTVTMQTAFANGTMLYTLDGSAPSLGSKLYTTALMIGRSCTVRAVAYSSDFSSTMQSPPLAVVIVPVLTATTPGGGGISVEPPEGAYAADAMATLTATPAAGWTFLQWLGDAGGTDPVTRVQMSRNKCVQAVFGTAVNTTTVGSGSIWQNPLVACYPYGTRIRFSGLPASGNYLAFWGNAVTSTDNPLDFPVTQPNQTVTAVFQPLAVGQFALALVAEGGGKVVATPAANRHSSGATVRLTAQPDLEQKFVGWSGDAAGSINPLTVTMNQSKAITAVFTKRPGLRVDTALEGLVEEGFRLTLTGEFGKQYEILGSADLVGWMQVGTLTNVYGTSQFTDGAATNQPRRFYRAAILSP